MTRDEYFKAVIESYPNHHFDILIKHGLNKVDILKKVAELMFIDNETDSLLAEETRKQLINLRTDGVCFTKED